MSIELPTPTVEQQPAHQDPDGPLNRLIAAFWEAMNPDLRLILRSGLRVEAVLSMTQDNQLNIWIQPVEPVVRIDRDRQVVYLAAPSTGAAPETKQPDATPQAEVPQAGGLLAIK